MSFKPGDQVVLTEEHKNNMRKHIAFLRDNADAIRKEFDMQNVYNSCGTPACSLGWASVSVAPMRGDCLVYMKNIFGLHVTLKNYNDSDYCFSAKWKDVNNTPEAAAARMEAVLYHQVPKRWNFTKEFAHPIVITTEELEKELETIKGYANS